MARRLRRHARRHRGADQPAADGARRSRRSCSSRRRDGDGPRQHAVEGRRRRSAVATAFGGGGHKNASGFTVDGRLADVRAGILNRIVTAIAEALGPTGVAAARAARHGRRPRHRQAGRPDLPRRRRAGAARARRTAHRPHRDARPAGDAACCRWCVGRATRLAQFLDRRRQGLPRPRSGSASTTDDLRRDGHADRWPDRRGAATPATADAVDRARSARSAARYLQMPPPSPPRRLPARRPTTGARAERAGRGADAGAGHRAPALELLDGRRGRGSTSVACSAGFYVRTLAHDTGTSASACGAPWRRCAAPGAGDFDARAGACRSIGLAARPGERRGAGWCRSSACSRTCRRLCLTRRGGRRVVARQRASGRGVTVVDQRGACRQPAQCGCWTRPATSSRWPTCRAGGVLHPVVVLM